MTLEQLFSAIDRVKVCVVGDFCLDAYWTADMTRSELSREVPQHPLPIISERYSPGGAGNVACNVAALAPRRVCALGVAGRDWRGDILADCLQRGGVDCAGLIRDDARTTNTYIKPMRRGISDVVYESPRLDFENYSPLGARTEAALIDALRETDADVVCVCDQMKFGCVTDAVREELCRQGRSGRLVIADSRDRIGLYEGVIVKPNETEASRVCPEAGDYEEAVRRLAARTGRPAIVTLGGAGCLVCEGGAVARVPARRVEEPIDACGAGDTFLAALACAHAAGACLEDAARLAAAASSIILKKLQTTGTASRQELRDVFAASGPAVFRTK